LASFGVLVIMIPAWYAYTDEEHDNYHNALVQEMKYSLQEYSRGPLPTIDQMDVSAGVCQWMWRYNRLEGIQRIRKDAQQDGNPITQDDIGCAADRCLRAETSIVTDRFVKALNAIYSGGPEDEVSCY